MAPLIVLIVFLGVYPKPVLDRITPSVTSWSPTSSGHPPQPAVATDRAATGRT